MRVALIHNHYDEQHLTAVINEMRTIGAPVIRCIWSDCYGIWLAIEGCHRLRAAEALGIEPVIDEIDLTNETITVQVDGQDVDVNTIDLATELTDAAWQATIIDY